MKIMKELVNNASCSEIVRLISTHYDCENVSAYEKLFSVLKRTPAKKNLKNTVVYINVFSDSETLVDCFNENDASLFYDVYAYQNDSNDITYSIADATVGDFLGFYIADETLKKFSFEAILAHCLWEITSYSFES